MLGSGCRRGLGRVLSGKRLVAGGADPGTGLSAAGYNESAVSCELQRAKPDRLLFRSRPASTTRPLRVNEHACLLHQGEVACKPGRIGRLEKGSAGDERVGAGGTTFGCGGQIDTPVDFEPEVESAVAAPAGDAGDLR